MSARNQPIAVDIDGDVYELEGATTKGVTLVHRVTGERRTVTHAELANLVPSEEQRSPRLLDHVPTHVLQAANIIATDLDEVLTGVGRNGKCWPEYDLGTTSQEQRIARKLTELERAGRGMARSTFFEKLGRYQRDGLVGLIDGRALRSYVPNERVEFAVINHLIKTVDAQVKWSTGTKKRVIEQATASVQAVYPDVKLPSRSAWYVLIDQLGHGKHATGSAKTRRSLANRPKDRMMAKSEPLLPGSQVEVDTNTMDLEVQTPKGQRKRVRLSLMMDVHSRTIMAYTFRLEGTKSVDHTLLLAQAMTPRANRPSRTEYRELLRQKTPGIHLLSDEEYELHAAEHPYIYPTNITVDRGTDYISPTFRNAVEQRGGSVLLSAPYTPTSKPHVERQFHTINSMFVQHLEGYVGRSPEHKGKEVPVEKLLTLEALRELFEDWVISVWQNTPHSGLRDRLHPTRHLTPNKKAGQAALTVAQLHVPLNEENFILMLESKFRRILDTGVKVNRREYDAPELNMLRGKLSNMPRHKGKWEVKVDPYNPEAVWVIGAEGELIECRERGAAMRQFEPDFAPVEDDYRALTAQADAELTGTPFPQAKQYPALPDYTVVDEDLDDDDYLPTF
ncbi:Mu transposase C-terminal domain-containing protein [Microbacterium esteraromaticum]|uniref:Mu transposase C-terminal domain-containing protein n=1 Tax=Microbacterium esteraromaticum TaxID=57043 RepID=UPI0030A69B22